MCVRRDGQISLNFYDSECFNVICKLNAKLVKSTRADMKIIVHRHSSYL